MGNWGGWTTEARADMTALVLLSTLLEKESVFSDHPLRPLSYWTKNVPRPQDERGDASNGAAALAGRDQH